MHAELHICFYFCARLITMGNAVAYRVLPDFFYHLCLTCSMFSYELVAMFSPVYIVFPCVSGY
jgi:hypothetical protein